MSARDLFNKLNESKAAHAIAALSEFVAGGGRRVPDEIYEERMDTCKACEYYKPGMVQRCNSCGCLLQIKLRFPAESCPENKWDKYGDNKKQSNCSEC